MRRLNRVVALVALLGVFSETPRGCGNPEKGPGEFPNVSPINSPHVAQPSNPAKNDRKHVVKFEVTWSPAREVTISWQLDSRSNKFTWFEGPWNREEAGASSGSFAFLTAENHGTGGFLQCVIYVDGKILVPGPGDKWNTYMHRNDAGDCRVSVVIP